MTLFSAKMRRASGATHWAASATQSIGDRGQYVTQKIENFIIVGITTDGKKFRPSDWADRLCGIMSAFGADHRMMYSPFVRPGCTLKGDKTVLVDARLYDIEPMAYKFMVNFAKDNKLQVDWIGDTPL